MEPASLEATPLPARRALAVLDAIYEGLGTSAPAAWLEGTVRAMSEAWRGHVGVVAYAYDLSGPPSAWRASYPIAAGGAPELAEGVHQSFVAAPEAFRARLFPALVPAGTFSETTGKLLTQQHARGARVARDLNAHDAVYLNAIDPGGQGLLLAINVPHPRRLAPHERRTLSMLSAHVGSARRLVSAPERRDPTVVFSPSGKVQHVGRGEVQVEPLRQRLLRLTALRSRAARTPPEDVLGAWTALVSGRFTLVDRFESDGKRFVVAYENPPEVVDPRGLSPLEASVAGFAQRGHSQKHIAYELGVSVGTVSSTLGRVFQKLGVDSRVGLVARLAEPTHVTQVEGPAGRRLAVFERPLAGASALDRLTAAEREVARAAAAGRSNAQIAAARGKSERTIAHQLSEVFRKLGVSSRAALAARLEGSG